MLQVDMSAEIRTAFGKGESRRLRMDKQTPGVVYGNGQAGAKSLRFDGAELYKKLFHIHGRNAVITLKVAGDEVAERHVMVQHIQKDPVTDQPLHVDFLEISLNKANDFVVPISYTGTAKGVDMGGNLEVVKSSVRLRGLPLEVPDTIDVDVTELEKGGEGINCGQLPLAENIALLEKSEKVCVKVI